MNHGVADKTQKAEFPTLYSPHPRANIAREWGTHSLEVRDKIHNGKEDGPPPPRCQATPLRSVREMCLLLTSPYIEPAQPDPNWDTPGIRSSVCASPSNAELNRVRPLAPARAKPIFKMGFSES